MLIAELMIAELPGELAMTRRLLARIPDDKLEWKPQGEPRSISWNANQLVEMYELWSLKMEGQTFLTMKKGVHPGLSWVARGWWIFWRHGGGVRMVCMSNWDSVV